MAGIKTTERLARSLMRKHGLHDWDFQWFNSKRTFGRCYHDRKIISMSKILTEAVTSAEAKDTILHEIAHALCNPWAGHGGEWKEKCREIGARPEARPDAEWNNKDYSHVLGVNYRHVPEPRPKQPRKPRPKYVPPVIVPLTKKERFKREFITWFWRILFGPIYFPVVIWMQFPNWIYRLKFWWRHTVLKKPKPYGWNH